MSSALAPSGGAAAPKGVPPRSLKRHHVGALPLLHAIAQRLGLRDVLERYVANHGNNRIPVVETLVLLSHNLTIGKEPLYELAGWVDSLDRRPIGYGELEPEQFNDDRLRRVLDRLYEADRACLMSELVTASVRAFALDLQRIHNDSTTIEAYWEVSGKDWHWGGAQKGQRTTNPISSSCCSL